MNVILEVNSGVAAGHKRALRASQTLEVGRSGMMDFAFQDDPAMSSKHFRIVAKPDGCQIEDLESNNGTFINGRKISRAPLRDRDKIVAGTTHFTVHVRQRGGESPVPPSVPAPTAAPEVTTADLSPSGTYTLDVGKNGIFVYRGSASQSPPAILAQELSRQLQQILIVDMQKLDAQLAEQVETAEVLLDWLPDEIRATGSPWLLTSTQLADPTPVFDQAWGQDTLVCVYSQQGQPQPLDQLRRCAGAFARPSVLRPLLTETVADVAQDLVRDLQAVLIEDQSPESWLLFSSTELDPRLNQIGLQRSTQPEESNHDDRHSGHRPQA